MSRKLPLRAENIAVLLVVLVNAALLAYVLAWPIGFEPQAWTPDPSPGFTGTYRPASSVWLANLHRVELPDVAPETVAIARNGDLYCGTRHGTIWRMGPGGEHPIPFARTGGRPLGLAFGPNGTLYVADAQRGLLGVSSTGRVAVLATAAGGLPLGEPDDLDVRADGTVYFSDAARAPFPDDDSRREIAEHGANGRLLRYDPVTRRTSVLLDHLYFANGVAVSNDGRSVLVTEMSAYRVDRYWLSGPKAGQTEPFVQNLPGFPDNITADHHGGYWVALPSPRVAALDRLLPHPALRAIVWRLPAFLVARPRDFGAAVRFDENGRVSRVLLDPDGRAFTSITNVAERNGRLVLGSLDESAIALVSRYE